MPTNAPDSRKTHITRIFGTNKKGERLTELWADVERMDVVRSAMQIPPDKQWQGVQRKLRWNDDPTRDDYAPDGPSSRLTEVMKVCDPGSQDVNDPDEWIPIRVIKGMKSQGGSGQGEGVMDRFLNQVLDEELRTAREVEVRRIVHHDTNIDDLAQAAVDADPNLREYVVSSEDYSRDDASKDADQYVEHEIATHLKHKTNSLAVQSEGRQTKLLNHYLIDASDPATQDITGRNGINPPYRLDPFQNIVNISFGSLAVEFFDQSCVELPTPLPNVKKGFGVKWFRVPQATIDAATAEFVAWKAANADHGAARPLLCGIIPLEVWGPQPLHRHYDFVSRVTGTTPPQEDWIWLDGGPSGGAPDCAEAGWYNAVAVFGEGGFFHNLPATPNEASHYVFNSASSACDPSYIGVDCTGDYPQLSINLVMPSGNRATFQGSRPVEAEYVTTANGHNRSGSGTCTGAPDYYFNEAGQVCMRPTSGDGDNVVLTSYTYESNADVLLGYRPETFRTLPLQRTGDVLGNSVDFADQAFAGPRVTGDHWHVVAFSFDLSGSVVTAGTTDTEWAGFDANRPTAGLRTTSACRLFVNFDGVNLTGADLSAYWPQGYGDENAILTVNGLYVACDNGTTLTDGPRDDCNGNTITVTQDFPQPKYEYRPTALPGGAMGFPATSANVAAVRHVEEGEFQFFTEIAADTGDTELMRRIITDEGKPAPMSDLADYIGKEPEVKLHGSGNWKAGRNTGTLAQTPPRDGTVIGRVKSYAPNPNLYGPQGR